MLPLFPLTSPEPPMPIRLWLPEALPLMSLPPVGLVLPATMVSVRSAVPGLYRLRAVPAELYRPPIAAG